MVGQKIEHTHTYTQDDDEQGRFLVCECGHRIEVTVNGKTYNPIKMTQMRYIG